MNTYEQRPETRPRSKSHLSFKSERSHKSQGSIDKKQKIVESPQEKRKSTFTKTGKANPNAAINEAQPIALALEKPTIAPLRGIEHKDSYGNPIADPDLSNPTRPRWERPLDTIKSFEAAIYAEDKRKSMMLRADTAPDGDFQSRRSSYFGGNGHESSRHSQVGGYYGNRSAVGRDRDTIMGNAYGGPPIAAPSRNRYGQRMQSEPNVPRYNHEGQPIYPTNGYQQSRDTVNTGGSGSGSEAWANGTDPSSENSSIERHMPVMRPDTGEQYGFNGFGGHTIMEDHQADHNPYNRRQDEGQSGPPPPQHRVPVSYPQPSVPPKQSYGAPVPLESGNGQQFANGNNGGAPQRPRTLTKTSSNDDKGEKRKSWFKRKFSKD